MVFASFFAFGNWNWFEGVVTLVATAAVLRAAQVLRETSKDEQALREKEINGAMESLVEGSKTVEWLRLGAKIAFLLIGIWAGFTSPSTFTRNVWLGLFLIGLFLMYLQGEVSIRIKRDQLRRHGVKPVHDEKTGG